MFLRSGIFSQNDRSETHPVPKWLPPTAFSVELQSEMLGWSQRNTQNTPARSQLHKSYLLFYLYCNILYSLLYFVNVTLQWTVVNTIEYLSLVLLKWFFLVYYSKNYSVLHYFTTYLCFQQSSMCWRIKYLYFGCVICAEVWSLCFSSQGLCVWTSAFLWSDKSALLSKTSHNFYGRCGLDAIYKLSNKLQ